MNLNFKVKTNPLHNANYYLDIDFKGLDVTNAKKIFEELSQSLDKPLQVFHKFAQVLVTEMLQKYEVITFEADDCDEIAMELKRMFINQSEESFDTYIREK